MRFEIDGRQVFASNGSAGAGSEAGGKVVLFVHGAGLDHTVWVMPARYFARHGWRVLAVDLPGHGRSAGPPLTRIEAMAGWLESVCERQGIRRCHVVGHSMGALVAYTFAGGNAVESLSLLGVSPAMRVAPPLLAAARDDDHAAVEMTNSWSHSPRGALGGNQNPGLWMLGTGQRLLERAGPGVLHADLAACDTFEVPSVAKPECPALIIAGERDRMTPARAGAAVAETLPVAQLSLLPGCGHSMLSEQPNRVLDLLAEHLRHGLAGRP